MTKLLNNDYVNTTPPVDFKDWPRWLDNELYLIRNAFQVNPVMVAVRGSDTLDISPVLAVKNLGIGKAPLLDYPEGSWDETTQLWTCQQAGIYVCNANCDINPFGSGNKTYQAQLSLYIDGAFDSKQSDGGSDDVPLGVTFSQPVALIQGQTVRMELGALHAQFTGPVNFNYAFSFMRASS